MKKIFFIVMFALFAIMAQAQQLAPKGIKIGKDPTAVLITDAISNGTNVTFKSGAVVLNPTDPDTANFETYAVIKSDTTNVTTGSYTTRYDFKTEFTNENLVRGLNEIGYGIRYLPFAAFAINTGATVADGRQNFTSYRVTDSTLITGVKFATSIQGAYTGDNTNSIALYKYNGTSWDKVAESANDATLWSATAASILITTPFTTPYLAVPGWYYIAHLYNNSAQTTAPAMYSMGVYQNWFCDLGTIKLHGFINTQNSHAANITNVAITRNNIPYFFMLY